MAFHNIRLDVDVEYGAIGGPKFNTTVWAASSGHEKRNINWSQVRAEYDIGYGLKTQQEIDSIRDHFYARQGRAHSFPFRDWTDYKIPRQVIGVTDGVKADWQIFKRYSSGGENYDRIITKIVEDSETASLTFKIWVNAVQLSAGVGASQYQINKNTGVVTLGSTHASTEGNDIEVECEFNVPVRYDIDLFPVSIDEYNSFSVGSIPLLEVRDID